MNWYDHELRRWVAKEVVERELVFVSSQLCTIPATRNRGPGGTGKKDEICDKARTVGSLSDFAIILTS